MSLYECVVLGRQELSPYQVDDLDQKISRVIADHRGQLVKKESWGQRNLSYRINKNKKANFLYYEMDASPDLVAVLNHMLKIRDDVLRHMIIRVEKFVPGETPMMSYDGDKRGFQKKVVDKGYRPTTSSEAENADVVVPDAVDASVL